MTQAPVDSLSRIEALVEAGFEKIDRRLDGLSADVGDLKVAQARTEERLNSIENKLSDFKAETDAKFSDLREDVKSIRSDVKGQDARLWGFVVALFLSLAGVIVKVVFFPQG